MRHKNVFTSKSEGDCIFFYLIFIIYQNHHWMMSVKRPHEEVTIGHLENKTKFKVSNNTGETSSAL